MATTKFILRIGLACLSLPVWGGSWAASGPSNSDRALQIARPARRATRVPSRSRSCGASSGAATACHVGAPRSPRSCEDVSAGASQQLTEPRHAGELPVLVVPEIHAGLPRERAGKIASLLIRLREELRAAFVDAHAIHRCCRSVIALAYDDVAGSRNGGGHSASLLPNHPLACSIRHRRESQSADQISDRKRVLCKALVESVDET
jgi:hypothetical protein